MISFKGLFEKLARTHPVAESTSEQEGAVIVKRLNELLRKNEANADDEISLRNNVEKRSLKN